MATKPVQIIGSFISPYVRKVLVVLNLKQIPYQIDPIIPFMGDDRFSRLSPVRRIPVLIDDRVTLADSSVICQYLDDRYAEPRLYPADIADRAQARWLEEFADTRMGEVFIWRLFNQRVINRFVWGEQTDQAIVDRAIGEEIPSILDYLEPMAPAEGFIFGALSIADISIAVFFRNAMFAKYSIDPQRWPKLAALRNPRAGTSRVRVIARVRRSVVPHAHRPASRRAASGRRADHVRDLRHSNAASRHPEDLTGRRSGSGEGSRLRRVRFRHDHTGARASGAAGRPLLRQR